MIKPFKEYFLINEMAARTRPRAQKLLTRLGKRLNITSGGDKEVDNLLPQRGFMHFKTLDTNKRIDHSLYKHIEDHGKNKRVPIHTILARQSKVSDPVLRKKIQGKYKDHDPDLPYMIHHEGVHYLIDGNHRVNAARLLGKTHIRARVADALPEKDDDD